jgi:hypothetical protein
MSARELTSDLLSERSDVRDLPCLDDLAIAQVGYHGLIHPKASPRTFDTSEARRHRARHDDASHLDVAVDDDLFDIVAKVRDGGKHLPPHRFLGVEAGGRQSHRRMNDRVWVEQFVECVEVARITGRQPPGYNCWVRIHRARSYRMARRGLGESRALRSGMRSRERSTPG